MRVTAKYGISGSVPFVDVHVEKDNFLFLDPSAIRNDGGPYAQHANHALVQFFSEVLRLRMSTNSADHVKGRELLDHLHEPNETRLGMSRTGSRGHAFGEGQSGDLWDLLRDSEEARVAVLTRLEHLRLFADGVGYDLVSDATTRIVFHVLASFTAEMMTTYPQMQRDTVTTQFEVFNPNTLLWEVRAITLPAVAGGPLLLVPKQWVYWRLLMDVDPFYNRFATETVQIEQSVVLSDGKLSKPTKKGIKENNPDKRRLNRRQAIKYKLEEDRNLVREYQSAVDTEFEPLSDEEIIRRTD